MTMVIAKITGRAHASTKNDRKLLNGRTTCGMLIDNDSEFIATKTIT